MPLAEGYRVEDTLARRIADVHQASAGSYGSLRLVVELHAQGRRVNRMRVARIMRERGSSVVIYGTACAPPSRAGPRRARRT